MISVEMSQGVRSDSFMEALFSMERDTSGDLRALEVNQPLPAQAQEKHVCIVHSGQEWSLKKR